MTLRDPRSIRGGFAAHGPRVLAATVLALWLGAATAQDLQVIELRHRLADDVIPTLQPLLEPGGVITGTDATLFVRTSPGNLEQIRQALALLDRRPRQLRITVGQGTVATEAGAAVRGAASVDAGDVQVGVNRPPGAGTGVAVEVRQGMQRADLHNLSSVTTLEGTETFIAVGQSAPIAAARVAPGRAGPTVVQTTEYREASTGFYATARVHGDSVTLDLSPQQQRFAGPSRGDRVETAGLTTQVSGPLGAWIGVGGSTTSSRSDSRGLLAGSSGERSAEYTVWVRVEEVP